MMFFYLSKEWFAKIYSLKTKCYLNYRNTVRHVLCNQSINQSINSNLENIKASLISDLKTRVEDRILEPENLKLLSKLINQAETIQEAIEIAKLGTSYKRTGFHFDQKIEKLGDTIKYFKKNEKLSFTQKEAKNTHKLIIGDNFDALQNLLISYKNKIDVIYIDPPYGKDDMGEFAVTNYNNAITRDNLLSMLYPRLVLAKRLLSDEGVIFVSIDERNHAYVKALMDEIFEERNFLLDIPRLIKKGGKSTQTIQKNHDYILAYTFDQEIIFSQIEKDISSYKYEDEYVRERGKFSLSQTLDYSSLQYSPNMDFKIEFNGKTYIPGSDIHKFEERHNGRHGITDWGWRWSKSAVEWGIKNGFIVEKENSKTHTFRLYTKTYLNCRKAKNKNEIEFIKPGMKPYSTIYYLDNTFSNDQGKKNLDLIFKNSSSLFKNPKPVNLIKQLLKMIEMDPEGTVLDFFAGSGTTGQAVLELNKEDGGNRKFILCTSNEKTDTNPNGVVYDVTSKRLKRVMTGCCYDGSNDFKWIKDNSPLGDNLDVYEISEVSNSEQRSGKTPFDVIDETLYDQPRLLPEEKIEWVCKNFEHTQKYLEDTKNK